MRVWKRGVPRWDQRNTQHRVAFSPKNTHQRHKQENGICRAETQKNEHKIGPLGPNAVVTEKGKNDGQKNYRGSDNNDRNPGGPNTHVEPHVAGRQMWQGPSADRATWSGLFSPRPETRKDEDCVPGINDREERSLILSHVF